MFRTLLIGFGLYAILATGLSTWVYFDALTVALSNDREAGRVRLSEAVSRLRGQLDVYRALVNVVAKNPNMAQALNPATKVDVSSDLSLRSLTHGASGVDLINPKGRVLASSAAHRTAYVYSRSLTRAALNGRLGYAIEIEEGQRLIRFSRGITDSGSIAIGAVVVSVNLAALEFEWPVTPEPVVFFDAKGLSMSANRSSLLLLSNTGDPEETSFPLREPHSTAGAILWSFSQSREVFSEVQTLTASIPQLQMAGQILLDTSNARATALLRLELAAALLLALALIGAIFIQQRRRLASEARHSATLELRVEERTAELQAVQDELVKSIESRGTRPSIRWNKPRTQPAARRNHLILQKTEDD